MMYDDKILSSCTARILEIYNKNKNKDNNFTLLLTSFAGLLCLLDEDVRRCIFDDFRFPDWFSPEKNCQSNAETEKESAIRHMRNSLCHFKLNGENIIADDNNQISCVNFIDRETNFKCKMTVEQMKELFLLMANKVVSANK